MDCIYTAERPAVYIKYSGAALSLYNQMNRQLNYTPELQARLVNQLVYPSSLKVLCTAKIERELKTVNRHGRARARTFFRRAAHRSPYCYIRRIRK